MLTYKLASTVLIFLAGLAGGLFAIRLERLPGRELATRLANTFAGGVFLGAGLLHLLADAMEQFRIVTPNAGFPIVALLVGLGFLALLLLDKVFFVHDHHAAETFSASGSIYPYVLMIALSLHSIITGTAFGLEDNPVIATAILIAVLAHKSTAAMAMTVSFGRANLPSARRRSLLLLFYCMTPMGVLLGTAVGSALEGPDEALAESIFDGLAAGTFLYVAVVNILTEEFAAPNKRATLFASTAIGFTSMALLAIWN